MSNWLIAFLMALGVSGWIYAKVMRHSGSQAKQSLTVAGVIGFMVFIFILGLLSLA